jgi:hypothetical protein
MSSHNIGVNVINSIRIPQLEKIFINKTNGQKFATDEVKIMEHKRNKQITFFGEKFSSNSKYTMIELGFDFSVSEKPSKIILKLRRNLSKINTPLLGYIWLVDKGDANGNMHFHLVVAIERLNLKGKTLPKELKITLTKNK